MAIEHQTGRVVRLEIENFKSYRGKEIIGPFKNFTTIIGPNGSGKSNLMDAISFVLGIKTAALRGNNLGELLYVNTDSQDPADHPDRGHVTLVFDAGNGTNEIHFTRAIQPVANGESFSSQYKIDGRTVTLEAYNSRLESFGILVRARNFLVFQGDIENVAQMSPKDLTAMFETISGSAALKKDHEAAELRKKESEAALALVSSKRRAITTERRLKKDQKIEAEKHMGLMAELEDVKVHHALWQVYHIQEDAKEAYKEAKTLKENVLRAEKAFQTAETEADEHRRRQAGVAKERLLLEKQIKKKRLEAEKKNPGLIKTREQLAHVHRRITAAEKDEKLARHKAKEHATKLASLTEQLEQLADAQKQAEKEIEEGRRGKLNLSPALLEEYNAIKRELGAKTSTLEAERRALQAAADADAEALRMSKETTSAVDERIQKLEESCAADKEKLASLTKSIDETKTERAQHIAQRDELRSRRRRIEARRSQLERRIEETEASLREAKAASKQSQREAAQRALIQQLRAADPDSVYGLVTDLAEVTSDKYKLAMSVVFGKDFDSVIVDTPETAMKCIQAAKERRMPPMTFLPAETIRVKEINPALRALGGTSRLAFDCLEFKDERCVRAFQSICGSALLCDTVDEARQLAFGGSSRQKVVAVDGTAFSKTGLITGGMTGSMEERIKRWDAEKLESLKEERRRLATELDGMETLRELTEALQAAEAAAGRCDNSLHFASASVKSTEERIKESKEQVLALKREKGAKMPAVAKLEAQIEEYTKKAAVIGGKIDEVADALFAEFSKKIGVSSIREYEGKHLKEAERLAQRKMAIVAQIARVKNQLEYESASDPQQDVDRLVKDIENLKKTLKELQGQEKEHEKAALGVKTELEKLSARSMELKASLDALDEASRELKKKASAAADRAAVERRALSAVESKLDQLKTARKDVISAAELDNIVLPVLEGRRATVAAATADAAIEQQLFSNTNDDDNGDNGDDDAMDVDTQAAGPSTTNTNTTTKNKTASTTSMIFFDFGRLTDDDLRRDQHSRQRHESEMKAHIEEIIAVISKMAPNLKALEQYDEVREKERDQIEEVEAARRENKLAVEACNSIKQRRLELFNAALTHICEAIDPIYKELTRSAIHPYGGQAYLSPENTEDPFAAGIKFSAMPPTKRFRDMEQLSGGEKTVAALALLFAVHSYHPSPFFVLDEVDAALDSSNVAKVAAYMRAKTRPGADGAFQGIVISLKDVFYEKADALVGVCRNPVHGCSSTLTFDLNRFGAPMGLY